MRTSDLATTVEFIFKSLGQNIKLATPLGLGKPNDLLNAIYDHAEKHKDLSLSIFTALSLAPPVVTEDLATRFFTPFKNRHWGENYPVLKYYQAAQKDLLPKNIQVHEFYFQAGTALKSQHLQRNYQSVNYTHVAENILNSGIQVLVQLIAKKETPEGIRYSLSCNPDLTLDVVDLYQQAGQKIMIIGVVHPDLPFLEGETEVGADFFAAVQDTSKNHHELFALPRMPMSVEDHFIGFYASLFVKDGGTVQIGIGSLSDAIVHALMIREKNNSSYKNRLAALQIEPQELQTETFSVGLYGLTEMLTDSFMHLHRAGILKRHVVDDISGNKTFVHGSFFLGSKDFYQWLRELKPEDRAGLRMTRISKVNDLYDANETRLRQQRVHARFFNTTMQVSILGDAASETLSNKQVISGVGGQYNFVSMAHELKGARSILMLRSVRSENKRVSNIISDTGHFTIPRHLRDIVITEYGIADLRGKTDEDCVKALLNITDSEFQNQILKTAQENNKVSRDYHIPLAHQDNTLEKLKQLSQNVKFKNEFHPFPFGSDFTAEEEKLVLALEKLKEAKKKSMLDLFIKLFSANQSDGGFILELQRMGLNSPQTLKEKIYKKLLLYFLSRE